MEESKGLLKKLVDFNNKELNCIGYEKLTVTGGTAQTLTIPTNAVYCICRLEHATAAAGSLVRYRTDNTAPTTTVGTPLGHFDIFDIKGRLNLGQFKIIAVSGTQDLHIEYYA